MSDLESATEDRNESFLRLLNEHERGLAVYVHSLQPDWAAAEDILQETRIKLWREFDKFEPGTHFLAWAKKIAFYEVLTQRKRGKRAPTPHSEEFLESVAGALEEAPEMADARTSALRGCVGKLPQAHRRLVVLRYDEEQAIDAIAGRLGRTEAAVYRALSRIRRQLAECVERALTNRHPGTHES